VKQLTKEIAEVKKALKCTETTTDISAPALKAIEVAPKTNNRRTVSPTGVPHESRIGDIAEVKKSLKCTETTTEISAPALKAVEVAPKTNNLRTVSPTGVPHESRISDTT